MTYLINSFCINSSFLKPVFSSATIKFSNSYSKDVTFGKENIDSMSKFIFKSINHIDWKAISISLKSFYRIVLSNNLRIFKWRIPEVDSVLNVLLILKYQLGTFDCWMLVSEISWLLEVKPAYKIRHIYNRLESGIYEQP